MIVVSENPKDPEVIEVEDDSFSQTRARVNLIQECLFCPRQRKLVGAINLYDVMKGDAPIAGYWVYNPFIMKCPNNNHNWRNKE